MFLAIPLGVSAVNVFNINVLNNVFYVYNFKYLNVRCFKINICMIHQNGCPSKIKSKVKVKLNKKRYKKSMNKQAIEYAPSLALPMKSRD